MKKLSIIAAIAALALFGMACTKVEAMDGMAKSAQPQQQWDYVEIGNVVDLSEVDPSIMQFVETYFPQTGILYCHQTQNRYKVTLNDQTKLHFTLTPEWIKVDCEHSNIYTNVPTSIVPEQITAYVAANFPNNFIEEIEKKIFGWEIELNNDHEIKFDADFNVIIGGGNGGGGNGGGGNGGNNNSNYLEINTFVDTYFPQTTIKRVKLDGNEYEVKLYDNTEIEFNLSFEWKNIDCENSQIYGMVPTEIVPAQITAYVTASFPNQHIDQIEKKHNGGWEIELSNGIEIEFDANFNVTEIDYKK